jgi:hypothetical protein
MLERFASLITAHQGFRQGESLPPSLLLDKADDLEVYYAPFDYVNPQARVVLVGITPGLQQAVNALNAARSALQAGMPVGEAARIAKNTGSFSGPMRKNLVDMLDHIRLNQKLGLGSCGELFTTATGMVHFTSMLRYPVFHQSADYSGSPAVLTRPLLRRQVQAHFAQELMQLPDAVIVPLGPKVLEVVNWLAGQGVANPAHILDGMPHPSGANAERIAYFLERKPREALSAKTNPGHLDTSRESLLRKVSALPFIR